MQIETHLLQERLLELLKIFHSACVENNIKYYICGGTLLGAVRHQGFIPWDDDIDVIMLRNDYNRFSEIAPNILPANIELRSYRNNPDTPFHYNKLIDTRTTLIERKYRNIVQGIYIDIFPLDGAGNSIEDNKEKIKEVRHSLSLLINHFYTNDRTGLRKLYGYYAKLYNPEKLHNKIENRIVEQSINKSKYLGSFLGSYGINDIYDMEWWGEPIYYLFEGEKFFGPSYSHGILSSMYNDYMELPPVEKRVNKHDYYYVNLSEPISDYIKLNRKNQ